MMSAGHESELPAGRVKIVTTRTVSMCLSHFDGQWAAVVTAVYDHNEYLSEKRRTLDAWSFRLLEIVEDKEAAKNVVPINH